MFEPPDARRSRRVWVSRGRAHLELATPAVEGGPSVRRALRRQLERLDGVEWAAVNDAVGRVLVTFDERRVRVDDVVDVIAAIEQARGGTQVFPLNPDHPADLEPLVAALVTVAVDTVGDRRRLRRPDAAGAAADPARDARAGVPRQPAVDQEGAGRAGSAPPARTWRSPAPARCCTR